MCPPCCLYIAANDITTSENPFRGVYTMPYYRTHTIAPFYPTLPTIQEQDEEEWDRLLSAEELPPSPTRRRAHSPTPTIRHVRRRLNFDYDSDDSFQDDSLSYVSISSHESDYLSDGVHYDSDD